MINIGEDLEEEQIPISKLGVETAKGGADSEYLYLQTQSSINCQQGVVETEQVSEEVSVIEADEEAYSDSDYDERVRQEHAELSQKLIELKRKRQDPEHHLEGDTEEEDLYCESAADDDSDSDCVAISEPDPEMDYVKKKKVKRGGKGPTDRSHYSQQSTTPVDFVPSSDDEEGGEFDDDQFEMKSWVLPKGGRKSKAKKPVVRQWYDENRKHPEDQFCLKLCFKDVYQFRNVVHHLHITQLRNFSFHRNNKDRVIVWCSERERKGVHFS